MSRLSVFAIIVAGLVFLVPVAEADARPLAASFDPAVEPLAFEPAPQEGRKARAKARKQERKASRKQAKRQNRKARRAVRVNNRAQRVSNRANRINNRNQARRVANATERNGAGRLADRVIERDRDGFVGNNRRNNTVVGRPTRTRYTYAGYTQSNRKQAKRARKANRRAVKRERRVNRREFKRERRQIRQDRRFVRRVARREVRRETRRAFRRFHRRAFFNAATFGYIDPYFGYSPSVAYVGRPFPGFGGWRRPFVGVNVGIGPIGIGRGFGRFGYHGFYGGFHRPFFTPFRPIGVWDPFFYRPAYANFGVTYYNGGYFGGAPLAAAAVGATIGTAIALSDDGYDDYDQEDRFDRQRDFYTGSGPYGYQIDDAIDDADEQARCLKFRFRGDRYVCVQYEGADDDLEDDPEDEYRD